MSRTHRFQIRFTEQEFSQLESEAQRREVPMAEVVRDYVKSLPLPKGKTMLKLCWLIDSSEIFNSARLSDEEFKSKQSEAQELSDGNMWWVQADEEPDLPRSEVFRHISREDMATVVR